MNDSVLITAEAIVTSNRAGHRSIFEADLDALTANPKQFYADPAKLKQAVQLFKQAGFTVIGCNKFGISILATKRLYEQTFKITLVAENAGGSEPPAAPAVFVVAGTNPTDLIDPQQSDFKDLLHGIAIAPPSQPLMNDPQIEPPPISHLRPEDIPGQLNGNGIQIPVIQAQRPVRILVIDSGCDVGHPYMVASGFNIRVESSESLKSAYNQQASLESFNPKFSPPPDQIGGNFYKLYRYVHNNDANGHGTGVTAQIIAMIRPLRPEQVDIEISKTYSDNDISLKPWFPTYRTNQPRPDVINCSYGNLVDPILYYSNEFKRNYYKLYITQISELSKDSIVVFAAGNYKRGTESEINSETQIPGIISVGVAYYSSQGDLLIASNVGHGFTDHYLHSNVRATPHVCGICGPRHYKILSVPVPQEVDNTGWAMESGTSFAAPQVAGLCALIKAVCPNIQPSQAKEILMRTSTPIEVGFTAQDFELRDIKHTVGADQLSPGLVNVKRALKVAEVLHFGLGRGWTKDVVKASLEIAQTMLGGNW